MRQKVDLHDGANKISECDEDLDSEELSDASRSRENKLYEIDEDLDTKELSDASRSRENEIYEIDEDLDSQELSDASGGRENQSLENDEGSFEEVSAGDSDKDYEKHRGEEIKDKGGDKYD